MVVRFCMYGDFVGIPTGFFSVYVRWAWGLKSGPTAALKVLVSSSHNFRTAYIRTKQISYLRTHVFYASVEGTLFYYGAVARHNISVFRRRL